MCLSMAVVGWLIMYDGRDGRLNTASEGDKNGHGDG